MLTLKFVAWKDIFFKKMNANTPPLCSHIVCPAYCWSNTSTPPKITHPVCRRDESRQEPPSKTTWETQEIKRRKIKHCQSESIWGTAVKETSKTVGLSVVRQALAPCTQWMTWKLQKDTFAMLEVASGLHVTLWLPLLWCQHKTALYSTLYMICSTDVVQFIHVHIICKGREWKKKVQMLIFHNPVSCTYAAQINTRIQPWRESRV